MTMTPVLMRGSDVIVARPFKWLEHVNPEGKPGEDRSPGSGDSVLLEGLI